MQLKLIGEARRWGDVEPGSLFNFDVDDDFSALGFRLLPNQQNLDAISFTHSPRKGASLPAFISNRYFENIRTVFVYERPVFQADQSRLVVSQDYNIPTGAFVSIPDGSFLRCMASTQAYDINLSTGELTGAINARSIWTQHWKLLDLVENVIYQQ